jgi:hypothetical protein
MMEPPYYISGRSVDRGAENTNQNIGVYRMMGEYFAGHVTAGEMFSIQVIG